MEQDNNFFANVEANFAAVIPDRLVKYNTGQMRAPISSFVLLDRDGVEVSSIISDLKPNSSTGRHNISGKILNWQRTI